MGNEGARPFDLLREISERLGPLCFPAKRGFPGYSGFGGGWNVGWVERRQLLGFATEFYQTNRYGARNGWEESETQHETRSTQPTHCRSPKSVITRGFPIHSFGLVSYFGHALRRLVPTLRVGMHARTLRVRVPPGHGQNKNRPHDSLLSGRALCPYTSGNTMNSGGTQSVSHTLFSDRKKAWPFSCIAPASTPSTTASPCLRPTLTAVSSSGDKWT